MRWVPAFFAFLLSLSAAGQAPASQPSPSGIPQPAEAEYRRANSLLSRQQFAEAAAAFENANKLAGGKCFLCLEAAGATRTRLGQFDQAIVDAREARNIAPAAETRARADNQIGLAYAAKAKKGERDSKELVEAEKAFRSAFRTDQKLNPARFHLAKVLIRQGRDKDADAVLDEYIKLEGSGSLADQARALKQNHRRATELFAPDFKLAALDGKPVTLEGLKGKVVLLDFWGTWCGPCLKALPELKELRKKFGKGPFEIISISVDKDRRVLEDFIKKNDMTWPQIFDENARASRDLFGVSTFPSYFVLDPEGIVVYRANGYSELIGKRLAAEIDRALKKKA